MIKRAIAETLKARFFKGKALIILGPRQAGKSTLVHQLLKEIGQPWLYLNGDEADVRASFEAATSAKLRSITGTNKIVYIDEAQRIPNIGLCLKLFTDQLSDIQVVATGSSSLELASQIREPLTGRKYEFHLYPFSFKEMVNHHGLLQEKRELENRMIYGYYPEIVTKPTEAVELIRLLANSYLYKDLLILDQISKPYLLEKIVKALALQLGNEVNSTELSNMVDADKKTIEKYIDLLEKAFVLFRVPAFSRNVRNEIRKGKKIYFYDCGIRNAVIGNFQPIHSRSDVGALWENFFIAERLKYQQIQRKFASFYFWRTTQQQEIDIVEECDTILTAFECKWNPSTKAVFPQTFTKNYPAAAMHRVSTDNFENFLL